MSALERWQERIRACRQERAESDTLLWQRSAGWYDTWVEQNDYVDTILTRLSPLISEHAQILEIGPGSGGFTVPLAGMAKKIVAVEPSPAMRAALSHNLAEAHHVEILPTPIEDSLPHIHGPFDLALAVYSLYNVLPIDRVIQKLVSEADLIVAVMGMGDGQAWYHSLYRHFRGRRPVSPPQVEFFYPVLEEMGIQAQVEIVQTSANYVYPDEVSLIDQWMQRLHANPAQRGELHKMLLPLVEQRGARVGIYGRRCTALVWFGKRPRIQHPPFQVVLRDSLCYNLPLD